MGTLGEEPVDTTVYTKLEDEPKDVEKGDVAPVVDDGGCEGGA
jgi:hypothetical protein